MNGADLSRLGAAAFRAAFPERAMPIPSGHLRAQSRALLRSGVREHVDAGYFLHGICEAMEARND